jgi:Zn-dependent M28 family amino/carboxypeptidase
MLPMRLALLLAAASLPATALAQSAGDAWWHHVEMLANDGMEGRLNGSPAYLRAADYVVGQFKAAGLTPAGTQGFLQPVRFVSQTVDQAKSSASFVRDGKATPLKTPDDIILSARGGPAPVSIDAPLVFIGYGLHIPEAGHDDLAGVDLKGKIAVTINGGPANISGALKSDARAELAKYLEARGAVGAIGLTTDKQREQPFTVAIGRSGQPAMYLADPALRDLKKPFFGASINPALMETLFAASGHSFADLAAAADASKPLPHFALNQSIRATLSVGRTDVTSPNIVGRLAGSDPKLAGEVVVVSAHLDGLGIGKPVNGDAIYNGALDNAGGVATVIEIAKKLGAGPKPKRSIIFVAATAEEQGLLGSRAFARAPSIPQKIVADLNFDMPLPLYPLKSVLVLGADESSLGLDAAAVGKAMGLPLTPDPLPDRNSFTRSDQYSFIRVGIPSLAFKFGFAANTPEAAREKAWRSDRYHQPGDDTLQPNIEKEDQARLNDFVAGIALRVADADAAPAWNKTSFFARFAK